MAENNDNTIELPVKLTFDKNSAEETGRFIEQQANKYQSLVGKTNHPGNAQNVASTVQSFANQGYLAGSVGQATGSGGGSGQGDIEDFNKQRQAAEAQIDVLKEIAENTKALIEHFEKGGGIAGGGGGGGVTGNFGDTDNVSNIANQLIGNFTNIDIPLTDSQSEKVSKVIEQTFQDFAVQLTDITVKAAVSFEKFGNTVPKLDKGAGFLERATKGLITSVVNIDKAARQFSKAANNLSSLKMGTGTSGGGESGKKFVQDQKELANLRTKYNEILTNKYKSQIDKIPYTKESVNAKKLLSGEFGGSIGTLVENLRSGEGGIEDGKFPYILSTQSGNPLDRIIKKVVGSVKDITSAVDAGESPAGFMKTFKKDVKTIQSYITKFSPEQKGTPEQLTKTQIKAGELQTKLKEDVVGHIPELENMKKEILAKRNQLEQSEKSLQKSSSGSTSGTTGSPIEVAGTIKIEGAEGFIGQITSGVREIVKEEMAKLGNQGGA